MRQINASYFARIVTEKYTAASRSFREETPVRKRGELSEVLVPPIPDPELKGSRTGNPTTEVRAISSQALEEIPLKVQRLSHWE